MTKNITHEFEIEILRETDGAYLVLFEDMEAWLPKSRVSLIPPDEESDAWLVAVPEWLAKEKGLLEN